MNISLPSIFKRRDNGDLDVIDQDKAARIAAAPKNGPRGGKPLSPGQYERKLRRVRRADSVANGRKSRRNAFKQALEQRHAEQDLRGVARVYILGHGNEHMRRNVTRHVEGMAEALVKAQGGRRTDKRVEETLEAIRGQLHQILVAWGDIEEEELVA